MCSMGALYAQRACLLWRVINSIERLRLLPLRRSELKYSVLQCAILAKQFVGNSSQTIYLLFHPIKHLLADCYINFEIKIFALEFFDAWCILRRLTRDLAWSRKVLQDLLRSRGVSRGLARSVVLLLLKHPCFEIVTAKLVKSARACVDEHAPHCTSRVLFPIFGPSLQSALAELERLFMREGERLVDGDGVFVSNLNRVLRGLGRSREVWGRHARIITKGRALDVLIPISCTTPLRTTTIKSMRNHANRLRVVDFQNG
jgi:hypothetical protein